MKYIGNCLSLLPEGFLEYLTTSTNTEEVIESYQEFTFNECGFNFDVVSLNLLESRKNNNIKIIKLDPGYKKFISKDLTGQNLIRYSIPLKDWEIGHIYAYGDEMLSGYKAGDIYKWDDPTVEYGFVNIGYSTTYMLSIDLYD